MNRPVETERRHAVSHPVSHAGSHTASEDKRVRCFVTNQQDQPIELYLASGVVVLAPRGEAELKEIDLAAPQLEALRRCRLITTRRVEEAVLPPTPAPHSRSAKRGRDPHSEA